MKVHNTRARNPLGLVALSALLASAACGTDPDSNDEQHGDDRTATEILMNRAYIVSLESDELTVIDLDKLEIIAKVPTGGIENHMGDLNADYTKLYIDSSHSDETVVVDLTKFEVLKRISDGKHPSHLSLHTPSGLFAIMLEGDNAISFLDTATDEIIKTLPGFMTPHFARYSVDGKWGYVANIGAHHITRLNMETLEVVNHIPLDGFPDNMPTGGEGGFADVQIDRDGVLHAAHSDTGRVMMVDAASGLKIAETGVGRAPWIVYAEHPFDNVPLTHLVPNFGDQTVSMIAKSRQVVGTVAGDQESYGVNYTSQDPQVAYVMNRMREDIALVDIAKGELLQRIPVGGNTETASTTPDGRYIVAAVSGANRVVVIDARTRENQESLRKRRQVSLERHDPRRPELLPLSDAMDEDESRVAVAGSRASWLLLLCGLLLAWTQPASAETLFGVVSERAAKLMLDAATPLLTRHRVILRTPEQLAALTDQEIVRLWSQSDALLFANVFGEQATRLSRLLRERGPAPKVPVLAVSGEPELTAQSRLDGQAVFAGLSSSGLRELTAALSSSDPQAKPWRSYLAAYPKQAAWNRGLGVLESASSCECHRPPELAPEAKRGDGCRGS